LTKYVLFHVYNMWSGKWDHGPYTYSSHIKTGAPIFCSGYTESLFAEMKLNFSFFLGICFCVKARLTL